MLFTYGSSWYSQARQNPGICGLGTATPQKSAKMMMRNGLKSTAMNVLGVKADMVCASVTEKSSVIKTMKKLNPALDGRKSKLRHS